MVEMRGEGKAGSYLGARQVDSFPPVPKGEGVQFHDILYTLSREILYTSARAQASAEVLGRCRGRRWKSGSSE